MSAYFNIDKNLETRLTRIEMNDEFLGKLKDKHDYLLIMVDGNTVSHGYLSDEIIDSCPEAFKVIGNSLYKGLKNIKCVHY